MEKSGNVKESQADAIARAILAPDLEAQEALQKKRAVESLRLAEQRKVAWFVLMGAALGTVIAIALGARFSTGTLWGGIAGSCVGWVWNTWRRRAAA